MEAPNCRRAITDSHLHDSDRLALVDAAKEDPHSVMHRGYESCLWSVWAQVDGLLESRLRYETLTPTCISERTSASCRRPSIRFENLDSNLKDIRRDDTVADAQ